MKRAVVFVDGQNLFHAAREAFGYTYPNYDVAALGRAVCAATGWQLVQVRFYTGVPDARDDERWSVFWAAKLLAMSRQGIVTFSRPLRYRNRRVQLPDGSQHTYLAGEEKGIDVRIAIDVIRMAHRGEYDVAVVFSQDQDLSEAAGEIRAISREQDRWIKIASAFPVSLLAHNTRGIERTDWLPIERAVYDACIDRRDYRRKPGGPEDGPR
ncbi:MAG TPA: NYN domain-containing protein [Thermoanaerobaculaceae bacterium]|nr:NYN domain-containing protein [Thermoanaerobaculaceae bacterium]